MRTRGQKLKQKQQGLPSSPPLQLATPPRRPRVLKKALAPVQQRNKSSLDSSSEIIFNSNRPLPSPQTPERPIALGAPSAEDSEALHNGSHELPTVLDAPSLATDATAYGSPQSRVPAMASAAPHSILHLWLDATQEDLASARPGPNPSIAMALPSSLIPDLLQYIARLADSTRANTLTLNVSSIGISPQLPTSNKRKLDDDAEMSQAAQRVRVEISQTPKRQKKKGIFSRMPLQDLETSNQTPTTLTATPPDSHGPATTFTRNSLYSKDGSLQLGLIATSQVIFAPESETNGTELTGGDVEQRDGDGMVQPAEEISTVVQILPENQPAAETPRPGRWGFGDLLKSARSVSKFLPGFPRALPVPTPVIEIGATNPNSHLNPTSLPVPTPVIEIGATNSNSHPNPTPLTAVHSPTNMEARSQSSAAQSLQLESPRPNEPQSKPETENSNEYNPNPQKKSPKKGSHSKAGIQANQKRADRGRHSGAYNSKTREGFAEAEKGTIPGTKRKRMSSPDIIPNPGGSSYGMDLDYFGFSSSEEEDPVITPTKTRPSKHRRLRGPDSRETMAQVDKGKARPYTGGLFSPETVNYEGGNIFNEVSAFESSKSQAKKSINEKSVMGNQQSISPRTPITNLTGSFRVPSPSDSDSDPEDSPTGSPQQPTSPTGLARKGQHLSYSTSASPQKTSPKVNETSPQTDPFTSKEKNPRTQSPPSKAVTSPSDTAPTTWTQPPPPRPKPSHAALPSVSSGDSDALARARKRALHYQPHKPSGLRASSRISSPRILEDSDLAVVEGNATSITQISTSDDIDTALAMRSENAVASKHGLSDISTNTESVENLFEDEVRDIAMKENATSLTAAESAPSPYVRDPKVEACLDAFWTDGDTKQASDMFEVLYAAFLEKN